MHWIAALGLLVVVGCSHERATYDVVTPDVPAPRAEASENLAFEEAPAPEPLSSGQVPAEYEFDPVKRIRGRVVFPPGTPEDEECEVVLLASPIPGDRGPYSIDRSNVGPYREAARVYVNDREAFELPVPTNGTVLGLVLRAHYLFIEGPVPLTAKKTSEFQEFKPQLGCWATIRLVPSDASSTAAAKQLPGRMFDLQPQGLRSHIFDNSPSAKRSGRLDSRLAADFNALNTKYVYEISSLPPWPGVRPKLAPFAVPFEWRLKPVAGKHVTIDVDLAMGFAVGGVVVDNEGAPLAKAEVRIVLSGSGADRTAMTQADLRGSFLFEGLARQPTAIQVSRREYRETQLLETEWGTDLRVVLSPCDPIRGRVQLANGTPVAGLQVAIHLSLSLAKSDLASTMTDIEGRFVLPRLRAHQYDVSGVARVSEDGRTAPLESKSTWDVMRVDRQSVMPDAEKELQLIMLPVEAVRLHVVDERGRAVNEFEAVGFNLERERALHFALADSAATTQAVRPAEGTYDWEGLAPGVWTLWARSPNGVRSNAVEVPPDGREQVVELVLPRAASVAGRIVGIAEVEGATVVSVTIRRVDDDGTAMRHGLSIVVEDGSFGFAGLQPGRYALTATGPMFLQLEPLTVDLPPGAQRTNIVLHMERAGRIVCSLVGADGKPLTRAFVAASLVPSPDTIGSGRTNQLGVVELGPLLPGVIRLQAKPGLEHLGEWRMSTVEVELSPGEVAEIEFRVNDDR